MARPAARAQPASACSSSVDLPTPGSPPSSTRLPATSPPPSTRSSSPIVLDRRSLISTAHSVIASGPCPSDTPVELGRGGAACSISSTSELHSLHTGHLPSHLVSACPQLWQRHVVRSLTA